MKRGTSGLATLVVGALVFLMLAPIGLAVLTNNVFRAAAHLTLLSPVPTDEALDDIPAATLNSYLDAATVGCDYIPWNVLAGVGKIEHDHGRDDEFAFAGLPEAERIEGVPEGVLIDDVADGINDDGQVDLKEQRFRADRLAEFLCEGLDDQVADLAPPPSPTTTSGVVHEVATTGDWATAVASAEPGDVIAITAEIRSTLTFRGPSGTPEMPIVITAAGGSINPGNTSNNRPALELRDVDHVHVDGLTISNSQFGLWLRGVHGSPGAPVEVRNTTITDIGHSALPVSASATRPSQYVRVTGNTIARTGLTGTHYGEGVYLGHGAVNWVDETSDIEVLENDISATTAEAVDIKPGTRNITVVGNMIHDLAPRSGGAISAHYVGGAPNPTPATNGDVVISGNAIWNQNLSGEPGANNWAIWVGHGGVTVDGNAIWGFRRGGIGVRVRALHDFGPHPIRITDNTFWLSTGWVATGTPSGASNIEATGNRGPAGSPGVEDTIDGAGAPPIGTGGTADNGGGPGSVFGFVPTHAGTDSGYENLEAAQLIRTALLRYNDDESFVDAVLDVAESYAALPVATGPDGQPVPIGPDGCPEGNNVAPASDTVWVAGYQVHTCIADSFGRLMAAATEDGVRLNGGAAWRDHNRQHQLRAINTCPRTGRRGTAADGSHRHVANEPSPRWVSASRCRTPTARPGQSFHESGRAIDFRYQGRGITTRNNAGYRWLRDNAATYGFYNLPSEPWHWSTTGR